MKVIQISDCHLFAEVTKTGYKQINPYQSLVTILSLVARHKPDLLLITGDLSGDFSVASYQHFKAVLAQSGIRCPYVIIPGNHDVPDLLVAQFAGENLWQNSPLVLANNKWHIHLLNTHYKGTLGYIRQDDLKQLKENLQSSPDSLHLIAVHHHPIAVDSWMDKHKWINREEFVTVIEQFPTVQAVIYGHIHADVETTRNGIKYLACPSTCWQWAIEPTFAVSELCAGFRVINLAEDGQISTYVQRVTEP